MATADPNLVLFPQQPELMPVTSLAAQMDNVLMVLNTAERLPILSEEIIQAVSEGEPYETLVRRLQTLHLNLQSLATLSAKAKFTPFTRQIR